MIKNAPCNPAGSAAWALPPWAALRAPEEPRASASTPKASGESACAVVRSTVRTDSARAPQAPGDDIEPRRVDRRVGRPERGGPEQQQRRGDQRGGQQQRREDEDRGRDVGDRADQDAGVE